MRDRDELGEDNAMDIIEVLNRGDDKAISNYDVEAINQYGGNV